MSGGSAGIAATKRQQDGSAPVQRRRLGVCTRFTRAMHARC
jgi:hypothetical protein